MNKIEGIAYIRVSTQKQADEGVSLEVQEEAVKSLLKSHGCEDYKVFSDKGVSGRDVSKRDAFQEALKLAIKYKVKYFAVYDTSRFARNTEQSIHYFSKLVNQGTELLCATGKFDKSPEGILMFSLLASFDEYRSSKDGEKIRNSIRSLREVGKFPHCAPPGYDNIRINGKADILINPKNAKAIQEALRKYAYGEIHSQHEFVEHLFRKGFNHKWMNPTSKRPVQALASRILNNPFYAGYFYDNGKLVKHVYRTLITWEEFQLIQEKLKGKRNRKVTITKFRPEFPLRGILLCKVCNRKLRAYPSKKGKYLFYDCPTPQCQKATHTYIIHEKFNNILNELKPSNPTKKLFKEVLERRVQLDKQSIEAENNTLKNDIKNLFTRKESIKESIYTTTSMTLKMELEKDFEDISNKITSIENLIIGEESKINSEQVIMKGLRYLENPQEIWTKLNPNLKFEYQNWLFPKGIEFDQNNGLRTLGLNYTYSILVGLDTKNINKVEMGDSESPSKNIDQMHTTSLSDLFYDFV